MRTGIVVEGGGMRGIYGAGVLDVLLEDDIQADGLIGVSARGNSRMQLCLRTEGTLHPV